MDLGPGERLPEQLILGTSWKRLLLSSRSAPLRSAFNPLTQYQAYITVLKGQCLYLLNSEGRHVIIELRLRKEWVAPERQAHKASRLARQVPVLPGRGLLNPI